MTLTAAAPYSTNGQTPYTSNGQPPLQPWQGRPAVIGSDTSPGAILASLSEWAAEHDRLTEEYGVWKDRLGRAARDLDHLRARARAAARQRLPKGTVGDVDALAVRALGRFDEDGLEESVVVADARLDAIKRCLRNAELMIDVLRTHAASARVVDPRSTYGA